MLNVIGPDVIYCDTDSIKFINNHEGDFNKINQMLQEKAVAAGAWADNRKGERYYLGTWDKEQTMDAFKTLGSKKYLYQVKDSIYSTIAGVKKNRGKEFFTKYGFDAFENGTIIEESGHLVAYRNDDHIHKITIKGCEMTTAANLALVDDNYTLGMTPKYLELLKALMVGKHYLKQED